MEPTYTHRRETEIVWLLCCDVQILLLQGLWQRCVIYGFRLSCNNIECHPWLKKKKGNIQRTHNTTNAKLFFPQNLLNRKENGTFCYCSTRKSSHTDVSVSPRPHAAWAHPLPWSARPDSVLTETEWRLLFRCHLRLLFLIALGCFFFFFLNLCPGVGRTQYGPSVCSAVDSY